MHHPLGLNMREAKRDTNLPVGGGPDGTQPVAILKGQQVGKYEITDPILPCGANKLADPTIFSEMVPYF
jgi:hypothetical protein